MKSIQVVLGLLVLLSAMGCAKEEVPKPAPPPDPEREAQLDAYALEAAELASGRKATERKRASDAKARAAAQAPREGPATVRGADVAPMQAPGSVPQPSTQLRESSTEWWEMVKDHYRDLRSRPGITGIGRRDSTLILHVSDELPRGEYEELARTTAVDYAKFKEEHLGVSRSTCTVPIHLETTYVDSEGVMHGRPEKIVSVSASAVRVEEPVWHQ